MTFNPEFRRNLWIELRLHRLIAMPAIVALVAALLISLDSSLGILRSSALAAFYGVVFLWGGRCAASAIAGEVNGRTWELQRMTALGAWSMAWGKLFGCTAFIWYGGLMILALFGYASVARREMPLEGALYFAGMEIAAGILVQAVALSISLILLSKKPRSETLPVTFSQLIGLAAVLVMAWRPEFGLVLVPRWEAFGAASWYGFAIQLHHFAFASVAVFAAWAVFGVYRLMRAELQFEGAPWGWPLFTLFVIAYLFGFLKGGEMFGVKSGLVVGFFVALAAAYISVFADHNGPLRYRAIFAALEAGRPRLALRRLPRWLPSVLLLAIFAGGAMTAADFDLFALGPLQLRVLEPEIGRLSRLWVAAAVLFALRDIGFVLLLNAWGHRRPDLTAFVYLVVLYGPAVWLLQLVAPQFAGLLVALPVQISALSPVSAAVQAAILFFLLLQAWRRPQAPGLDRKA
ncbi:MAG: hypothetical protein WDZ84_11100 [Rhodovibrionaceae bacterium]